MLSPEVKKMRRIRLVVVAGCLLVLLTSAVGFAANKYQEVDATQVKALMDNDGALVVFPLSPIEFDNMHIEGSVNIVMDMLEEDLPRDKERKIVFYCLGVKCVASWRAAEKAADLGYQNVYAFREGIPGWEEAGYPLVSTNPLPDVAVKKMSTLELVSSLANEDMILLDINLKEDAEKFFIDHAKRVHIPLDDLKDRLSQLPKDKKICIVCLKGKRSPTAAKYLVGQGYKNVVVVEGGVQKWVLEGRPVRKSG